MDLEVVVEVGDVQQTTETKVGNIHVMDGAVLNAPNLTEADEVYISAGGSLVAPNLANYNVMAVSPSGASFN